MCFHFAHHPTIDLIGRSGGLERAGGLPQRTEEQRGLFTTHSLDNRGFVCVCGCVGVCEGGSGGRDGVVWDSVLQADIHSEWFVLQSPSPFNKWDGC